MASTMTTSQHRPAAARVPLTAARIPRVMTAGPTAPPVARVPLTAAPIPEGQDGGADGTAGGEGPPTAAPTPRVTTAGPTALRDRGSMLSRCIATDPRTFARELLGAAAAAQPVRSAAPRLQRSALGRPSTSCSLSAGYARPSSAWPRRATSSPGTVISAPAGSARRCPTRWTRRRCSTNSPRAQRSCCRDCTDCGRRSSTSCGAWSTIWDIPFRPTRTSRRRRSGFDPHYDVHDVFVLQTAGRNTGPSMRRSTPIRSPRSPGPTTVTRSRSRQRRADHRHRALPGDALYLPRGWVHSARALADCPSI